MMEIKKDEIEIVGKWLLKDNKVIEDENSKRIHFLIDEYFQKVSESESGWEILYQDPNDKRYWELKYLNSDLHGGGPPSLFHLPQRAAIEKYNLQG